MTFPSQLLVGFLEFLLKFGCPFADHLDFGFLRIADFLGVVPDTFIDFLLPD
jgi:hypothetical protein